MKKLDLLLEEICKKEIDNHVYNIKIKGIPLYNFIRQNLRTEYLMYHGIKCMDLVSAINVRKTIISAFISIYHISKLLLFSKSRRIVFVAFPRVDKIGSYYCDKFTDPLIDCSNIGDDYIIFENGRGGIHRTPRLHSKHLVYSDIITITARLNSNLLFPLFKRKYKKELSMLFASLYSIFDSEVINEKKIVKSLLYSLLYTKQIKYLYKTIGAKHIFACARPSEEFSAAKLLNMNRYEIQHGITYSETILYSGYSENMTTPDLFLAFGDNNPKNVYGIEKDKILCIGWALPMYLAKVAEENVFNKKDVLVISEPEVSDAIICAVLKLAEANPDLHFYIRPHPHETYSAEQLRNIHSLPNVNIQDNSINISLILQSFERIIGENSTVLYEALAVNKKVGKLFFEDLHPIYLTSDDKESFWEIYNIDDFTHFLNGSNNDRKFKSIYSYFNGDLLKKLIDT